MTSEIRFIADCMLGKLSRWLRICGFDTLYYRQISDLDLLAQAEQENRVILTRDHVLLKLSQQRNLKTILITYDLWEDQLKQVVQELNLKTPSQVLRRCLNCNEPLIKVDKTQIETQVPAYVLDTEREFSLCPRCGKVFWPGTHWVEMRRSLNKLFGEEK
ncbi:MAG: Mut7-C RNAse domain-containing protein [bacterium]|nr:Mut7-C RNAse domain-containing protein [bacterium]